VTDDLDGAPCGHLLLDPRRRIVRCNLAVARWMGCDRTELEGQRFDTLFSPPSRLFLQTHIFPTLHADGAIEEVQVTVRPRTGDDMPVLLNGARCDLRGRGGVEGSGYEIVVFGIAKRASFEAELLLAKKAAEHAQRERELAVEEIVRLRKHESLSLLAAGVAHDFNNLLCAIMGNAQLLGMALPAAHEGRVLLQEIEQATSTAVALTGRMLAFAGAARLSMGRTRVGEVVRDCLESHPEWAARVRVRAPETARPDPIRGDRAQLAHLVQILLSNALEASAIDAAPVEVAITLTRLPRHELERFAIRGECEPGDYVQLEVVDRGHGMNVETRDRAFEPFYSTRAIGRGLGLSTAMGIVRAHRGAIELTSAPGLGTTATVLLPVAPDAHPSDRSAG
jgi:signal transduction histidine kinase